MMGFALRRLYPFATERVDWLSVWTRRLLFFKALDLSRTFRLCISDQNFEYTIWWELFFDLTASWKIARATRANSCIRVRNKRTVKDIKTVSCLKIASVLRSITSCRSLFFCTILYALRRCAVFANDHSFRSLYGFEWKTPWCLNYFSIWNLFSKYEKLFLRFR